MMHDGKRISGLLHVDARQGPPGAADQIEIAIGAVGQPAHGLQGFLGDRARPHHIAAGAVRQAQHPQRQGAGRVHLAVDEVHHLQRAAADIGQNAVGRGNAAEQAIGGKSGLLLAGQHADLQAGEARLQVAHEIRAVAGIAYCRRREHLEGRCAHGAGDRGVTRHDGERLFEALLVEPTGLLQAAAEA